MWIYNFRTCFFDVEIQTKKDREETKFLARFFYHLLHHSDMYLTSMPSPLARESLSRSRLLKLDIGPLTQYR